MKEAKIYYVKKKKLLIILFLFSLISGANATINVTNGDFETGDFTNWTITDIVGGVNPLDKTGVSTDGNTLTGTKDTYDLNSFEGTFAGYGSEFAGCAGSKILAWRFGSDTGVEVEADEHVIISQGQAEVPTYALPYTQICGTSPSAGTLVLGLVTRETSTFSGNDYTHSSQQVGIGDQICVFTQAGQNTTGGGTCEQTVSFDLVQLTGHTLTITEPPEPIPSLTSFEIRATIQDINGDFIEAADVNITLDGDTNAMAFSNGAYRITFPLGLSSGAFPFDVNSNFENVEKGFSGTLVFEPDFRTALNVTNINNTSIQVDSNAVNVTHSTFNKQSSPSFAYQVENISDESVLVNYIARGKKAGIEEPTRTFLIFTDDTNSQDFKLNDSLTFSIDRLWNSQLEEYEHFFERNIDSGNTQQYKLDYKKPLISFESLTDQDFFTTQASINKINIDNRFIDEISINKFSRMVLTPTPDFAAITSPDTINSSYVVSFTASVDSGTLDITIQGDTETITTEKKTIYLDANGFFEIVTEQPSDFRKLQIENFVVMERGFFARELEVFDEFGNDLPIVIDDTNNAFQVLEEGQNFSVSTEIYERGLFENQDLNVIIIDAFVFGVEDQNTLIRKEIQVKEEDFETEVTIEVNEILDGIITTSTDLDILTPLVVRVRACGKRVDTDATSEPICFATQETQNLVLRQFPFSNDQILMRLSIDDFFVGENPEGSLFIETDFLETIEYVVISVFSESNDVLNPDVNETFFKDKDFQCIADFCDFDFRLSEWGFEEAIDYSIQATLKVTTSDLDYNNTLLNEIVFLQAFHIGYKERFVNLYNKSRDARIFKDFEKIPILLNLRDNLNLPSRDDLNVIFRVWDLGTSDFNSGGDADPTFIQLAFDWDVYEYDINKGTNRYAFIGRLREKGGALQDGHFYRILVEVDDHTKKREAINPITLSADKLTGGFTSFTDASQQTNEVSFKIDSTVVLDAPLGDQNGLRSLTCVDPQTAEMERLLRVDALSQSIDRAGGTNPITLTLGFVLKGGLRFGSSLLSDLFYKDCHLIWVDRSHYVDSIRVYVYNSYSDLAEQDPEFKQYMDFTIGEELIIFNDGKDAINDLLNRSPSQCKTAFNADTLGRFECSVTAFANGQTEEILRLGADVIDMITNGTDLNTIETINPQSRYMKFQIDNLRPKNVRDFEEIAQIDFSNVPDTKILKHLIKDKGLRTINDTPARVTIFQNNRKIKTIELPNNLFDRIEFDQFADQNGFTTSNFDYFVRVDLCFNSGRNCLDPQILKFTDQVFLKRPAQPLNVLLGVCVSSAEEFSNCVLGFFTTPEVFVVVFIGIIISLIAVFVFVMVRRSRRPPRGRPSAPRREFVSRPPPRREFAGARIAGKFFKAEKFTEQFRRKQER